MEFQFQIQITQDPDGQLYIPIPDHLDWSEHDDIQITIINDLDTLQPAMLLINLSERKKHGH